MTLIVISNEQLDGARGVIHSDALKEFALRGWVEVGPAVSPLDTRTVDEAAAEAAEPATKRPAPAGTTETSADEAAEPPTEADAADADAATASTNKE